ncbi:MAG: hypothetical protein GY795_01730 [Desulfobacterales bacterium]|nr:hypothetical protein [Desulfobacterales bacterium]
MRIRAFLYGGVIFLVMNVAGQLFCRYPEEGLNMGILLTVLGTVIMIWFNIIKRESILRHVRILRADLECWA